MELNELEMSLINWFLPSVTQLPLHHYRGRVSFLCPVVLDCRYGVTACPVVLDCRSGVTACAVSVGVGR